MNKKQYIILMDVFNPNVNNLVRWNPVYIDGRSPKEALEKYYGEKFKRHYDKHGGDILIGSSWDNKTYIYDMVEPDNKEYKRY